MDENLFNELYEKKAPKRFRGTEGRKQLFKILTMSLQYSIYEVGKLYSVDRKTICFWLKEMYPNNYKEVLDAPREKLFPKQPTTKYGPNDTPESFSARLDQERKKMHAACEHDRWIMRCSLCGLIMASDALVGMNTTIKEIIDNHTCKITSKESEHIL